MADSRGYERDMLILPIGSMYAIYANIWGILMVNVTINMAYRDPSWVMQSYSHLGLGARRLGVR